MSKTYEVEITRTQTSTTKFKVEMSDDIDPDDLGFIAQEAEKQMNSIINGEDPTTSASDFEWEIVDDTAEVETPEEDVEPV